MDARVRIRPARPDEAELLLSIQRAASVAAFAHIFPPERYAFPEEAVLERWQEALAESGAHVVVAEVEGRVAGLASVRPKWLDGLYVLPEFWGTGVADRLHDHAVERLLELECACGHLWVLEDNVRARRFYERRGWHLDEETRIVPFPPNPLDVRYTRDLR